MFKQSKFSREKLNKENNKNNYNNNYNNNNKRNKNYNNELENENDYKIFNEDDDGEGLSKKVLFEQDDLAYKKKQELRKQRQDSNLVKFNDNNSKNHHQQHNKEEEETAPIEDFNVNLKPIDFSNLLPFKKQFLTNLQQPNNNNNNNEIEYIKETTEFIIEEESNDQDNENNNNNNKNNSDKIEYFPKNIKIPIATTGDNSFLPGQLKLFFKKTEFKEPTTFQKYAWPAILCGNDMIGTSLPGSGKTLGYLAPMIPHCLARMNRSQQQKQQFKDPYQEKKQKNSDLLVLVLVPTRELGLQVFNNFKLINQLFGIKALAIYGGIPKPLQIEQLQREKPQILISTPGRLIEMIDLGHVNLSTITMLVLDEADKMLSKGLLPQLKQLRTQIRPDSQNILLSATFPESMKEVAKDWIKDPSIRLRIGSSELPKLNHIEQTCQLMAHHKRPRALVKLLTENKEIKSNKKTIIFFNKIKELKRISIMLLKSNIKHDTIFGNIDQEKREKLINKFSSSRTTLLLSTDIVGRGIHIDDIHYVINYDFPRNLEQYCHRVGRAGRTDKVQDPKAFSFLTTSDGYLISAFVDFLKDQDQALSVPFLKQCNEKFGTSFEFQLSKRKIKEISKKKEFSEEEKLLKKYDKLTKNKKYNDSDDKDKKIKSNKKDSDSDSDSSSSSSSSEEDSNSDSNKKNKNKKIKRS
ncbi:hypothetical protein DICPUDRAFT_38798 [Dictyostelium purpureum]|uniref:RNA helicase n=1 Tax=Dictyostelium purpureum TaxID=5786 RepID=F0ZV75_DICPU|nr:uncharacterized protein DICPUDRAFT_38798 [Dictyostelium purpureum]EGC32156.1 hypothetical protein DICPUDRAFT_38798 [Dictyostelium purpureum]|eukprot:XP_003291328.1 hypothetical protein DICPUDRAFT_38798 [Dictyostelium purpureum]